MQEIARTYASSVERDYTPGTYSVHPGNTSQIGNARNYFFYEYGTYAFDIEVCGVNRSGVGIIHPTAEMKTKIADKNIKALMTTLMLQM